MIDIESRTCNFFDSKKQRKWNSTYFYKVCREVYDKVKR